MYIYSICLLRWLYKYLKFSQLCFITSHTVYERCNYELNGRQYSVRHGETFINIEHCTRCLCQNGQPEYCKELGSCRRIRVEPTDVQGCIDFPGVTMEHGDIRKVYMVANNLQIGVIS